PVFVVSAAIMKNSFKNAYGDCRDIEAELTDYVVSSYDGFADIRLYGLVDRWISGVKEIHRRYIRIGNRAEFLSGLQDSATTTVSAVLKYGAFAVAGAFVLWGDLELGAALASATLAGKFFAAAGSAAELLPRFSQAEKAMERLSVWVSPFFEENADVPALENASVDGVLSNLTFKTDLNGIIRIKGENGSGKTTLIKLLAGMIKPDRGGCKSISAEKIAYLSQHEPEFGVSGNELLSCVSGAEKIAAEFGLSSEILASGVDELSGGERKKVFLSLVFARDSELIILDEPTNSLDESGIRVLRELIKNRGRGVLFVCHGSALDGLATCELTVKNGEVCAE
ncbi:MAG: ATP-binding cassette domain-containing protein, partial [Clostridia bacterium]|nr:ATP-binding cassette domain-containing protein [Clostridia bacterium]